LLNIIIDTILLDNSPSILITVGSLHLFWVIVNLIYIFILFIHKLAHGTSTILVYNIHNILTVVEVAQNKWRDGNSKYLIWWNLIITLSHTYIMTCPWPEPAP